MLAFLGILGLLRRGGSSSKFIVQFYATMKTGLSMVNKSVIAKISWCYVNGILMAKANFLSDHQTCFSSAVRKTSIELSHGRWKMLLLLPKVMNRRGGNSIDGQSFLLCDDCNLWSIQPGKRIARKKFRWKSRLLTLIWHWLMHHHCTTTTMTILAVIKMQIF